MCNRVDEFTVVNRKEEKIAMDPHWPRFTDGFLSFYSFGSRTSLSFLGTAPCSLPSPVFNLCHCPSRLPSHKHNTNAYDMQGCLYNTHAHMSPK